MLPSEPTGYLNPVLRNGTRYLLQFADGDAQVSPVGSQVLARGLDACCVDCVGGDFFGVPNCSSAELCSTRSVVTWVGVKGVPHGAASKNIPLPPNTNTHECPRRIAILQDQIASFVQTSCAERVCEGECTVDCTGTPRFRPQ